MTVKAYLRVLRERWRLIVVITLLCVGLAVAITSMTRKVYRATAQVLVSSNVSNDAGSQYQAAAFSAFAQSQVATYAKIIGSPEVLHAVETDLSLALTDSELKAKISAAALANTTLINVSAIDGNADTAAALANSAARGFVTAIERYATPAGSTQPAVRLFVTGPADAPSSPATPNAILNIGLGITVGLFLGAALAVTREVVDNRIKSPEALAKAADSPAMGVVVDDPKTPRHVIATRAGTRNIRAENYRQLRANLQFANVDQHPRVIAVTSSIPAEGKTTVAINLASTLAEAGFSVCLVDADLRRPTVAKMLGLLSPVGLTSVLIHQIELSEALQNAGSSFYVLTSGPTPPNPSEVLASSFVRDVIRSLLDKVDYVVIDTAPILPVSDGSEVAALADGTLLVARHGFTTDAQVKRAIETLDRVDAKLLGVVLNRLPAKRNRDEYGYTYYRSEDGPVHAHNADKPQRRRDRRKGKVAEDA